MGYRQEMGWREERSNEVESAPQVAASRCSMVSFMELNFSFTSVRVERSIFSCFSRMARPSSERFPAFFMLFAKFLDNSFF